MIFLLSTVVCTGQIDPRTPNSTYDPVESLTLFKDSFIAAYNSGNRDFIRSMVLDEAVVKEGETGMKFLNIMLPPHFNTHEKILGLEAKPDAIEQRLHRFPDSFTHLGNGIEAFEILTFVSPRYNNGQSEFKTFYSFLVVKKNGKLFIGSFNDKKVEFYAGEKKFSEQSAPTKNR